jgi:hypothetical protein
MDRHRPLDALAVLLLAALCWGAATARVATAAPNFETESAERTEYIKRMQQQALSQGARVHMREARAEAAWKRWKQQHPNAKGGERARPANENEEGMLPRDPGPAPGAPRFSALSTQAVPTNVRCNNPASNAAGAGQAEQSIASWGNYVLVAFNDGQGFVTGGDVQNYAYSLDGGATFVQPAGGIPHPPGASGFSWSSDPSVTVNEKTGEFYYCGLFDSLGTTYSGLGIVKATFPGGGAPPVWGVPHTARTVNAASFFIDKQWIVADSSNGNIYVTYTYFTPVADSIVFRRSSDGGTTWGPLVTCNSDTAAGWVQGSRPVVGPNGEVYVTWYEIGQSTSFSHMRIRKSTNAGASFGAEAEIAQIYDNFGTGAPGFNRQRGISFPGIAVDRTNGPHRGRVYSTWNESVNWYNDGLGGLGTRLETESNNTTATANSFTPGQQLSGSISSSTDVDYYSFSATQGTTYIFWCSLGGVPALMYTMRVMCSDGTSRLALSGSDQFSPGADGFIVWTAPTTATYYFRMAYNGPGGTTGIGSYSVLTGTNGANTGEHARDQRDVFVSYSDDGTTWSTPARPSDDLARFDNWLPEVAVGADGMPYAMWFDFRDATNCAGNSHIYMSRSVNGGTTWDANQRVTSVISPWTTVATNIAPNQGDYNILSSGGRFVFPAWADGRGSDVDVWSTKFDTGFDFLNCPNDTAVTTGTLLPLTFAWANRNAVFPNDYTYQLTDDAGWTSSGPVVANVAAGGSASVNFSVPVPSPSTAYVNTLRLTVSNATGAMVQTCAVNVTVSGNLSATPAAYVFGLRPAVPNPTSGATRIDFTLARADHVRLAIYSLSGQRIRTLLDGAFPAGPGSVSWDARDDHGRAVHAGAYFYRLDSGTHSATQRLILLP